MSYMKRLSKCLFFKKPPLPKKFLGALLSNNSALKCLSKNVMVFAVFEEVLLRKIDQQFTKICFHILAIWWFEPFKLSVSVFWAFWVLKLLKDIDGNVHFPLGDVWQTELTLIDSQALPYYRINLKFFYWPF